MLLSSPEANIWARAGPAQRWPSSGSGVGSPPDDKGLFRLHGKETAALAGDEPCTSVGPQEL